MGVGELKNQKHLLVFKGHGKILSLHSNPPPFQMLGKLFCVKFARRYPIIFLIVILFLISDFLILVFCECIFLGRHSVMI